MFVLLDSYAGFQAIHERIDAGRWLDLFTRLVADGRQVGVHFVITADRRSSVPMSLVSSLPRRLVLRLANDDEYANAGEPVGILSPNSPPGRAIMDGTEVQVAVLGGSANGERQADEIARLAARLRERRRGRGAGGRCAARRVPPSRARRAGRRPSGWRSPSATPTCDGGGSRSTRATCSSPGRRAAAGRRRWRRSPSRRRSAGIPLFHVHVRPTPLAHAPFWGKVAQGPTDGARLLERIAGVAERFGRRALVVVDDLGELCDTDADTALTELLRARQGAPDHGRSAPSTTPSPGGSTRARSRRCARTALAVLLQPDTDNDGDLVGVTLPRRTRVAWPEGRGFLAERGAAELIHVALPDPW